MSRMNRSRGFTLTELLVATAIFTILMSAIVALFVASLRAVKSAYLASDAYETSRGAFAVVERDLTTVFTMRDYGDYYQFFGTPQGMMMVGLIKGPDGSTTLGRITYVIHPVVIKDDLGDFVVTDPFDLPQLNTRPVPIQFSRIDDAGTPADPTDDFEVFDDVFVGTAALIRYVEPGIEDLDTYPFEWDALVTNPEFGSLIKAELDNAIRDGSGPQDSSDPNVIIRLNSVQRELLAAKKRQLWIRMLSGQEYWYDFFNGNVPRLPDVWGDGWLDVTGTPLNPRDYVVAENIGLETPAVAGHPDPFFFPLRPLFAAPNQNFFHYGRIVATAQIDSRPTWNFATDVTVSNLFDGIDNDFDGFVDEPDEVNIGNPLTPRLPEVVTLRLPFAYERPYPTAPQFERNLEQVIDVPTAYTRTALVAVP